MAQYLLLALLGVAAGVVNMMAGGGSNLILPVLMMFGVPADIANGSNRVGVLVQSVSGLRGFYKAGRLPTDDLLPVLLPTLVGGLFGALVASFAPVEVLKPAILLVMLAMAALVLFKPGWFSHSADGQALTVAQKPAARIALALAGVYGGFLQAGAGFVMLPVLAGMLRYDLVRANALKVCCTMGFTVVSLAVFVWRGQVWWDIGLVLAAGSSIGAWLGVKMAVKLKPQTMRWVLFLMTLVAVVMAFLK